MEAEYTVMGESILIAAAILYSTTIFMIGRRIRYPASVAAYGTAVAILVSIPLLSASTLHRVDRVVGIVGAGRLLFHPAFMAQFCGLFLTFSLATNQWSRRHHLAISGTCVLTAVFVILWLHVKTLHLPGMASMFYGIRAGRPSPVLWMNLSMACGLVYIAAWNVMAFRHILRHARTPYERGVATVTLVLFALLGMMATLSMVEAVGHHMGLNMTVVQQVKTPIAMIVLAVAVCVMVGHIWLRPLWRNRRQLLLRYIEPELVQLRKDLLNLSASLAELHLDIHHTEYANRAIVDAVVARCRTAGISPARIAIARMAATLTTFQRANVLQDPGHGVGTSWDSLVEEAAAEIDQSMAETALQKALHDSFVSQHVYIVMFLVLDCTEYREHLLIHERPRVQSWHERLADIVATAMHEHGQSTSRFRTLSQGQVRGDHGTRIRAKQAFSWVGPLSRQMWSSGGVKGNRT